MSHIDWSKAPEGAEFWNPNSELFYRSADGEFQKFSETRGRWTLASGERHEYQALIAKPAPWKGEGLPPVGTACEVQHPDKPETWCKCTILVWDSECAVFSADANYPFVYDGNGYPESFRPIRTPEQIAAEDREGAIHEMFDHVKRWVTVQDMCGDLYDAGYRKFEIVEGE